MAEYDMLKFDGERLLPAKRDQLLLYPLATIEVRFLTIHSDPCRMCRSYIPLQNLPVPAVVLYKSPKILRMYLRNHIDAVQA